MKDLSIKSCDDFKYLDEFGNVVSDGFFRMAFFDSNDNKVSKDYYYIEPLGNTKNHYIVVDLIPLISNGDCVVSKYKYGIISLSYDLNGNILPFNEKIVVPIIYDSIQEDAKNMISVTNNSNITYVELDINSKNYGKQLVPCILVYALPFDHTYKDFAFCSIDGKKFGYIKRSYNLETLTNSDLLTREQVRSLTDCVKVKRIVKRKK